MATFTWTATGAGTTAWETAAESVDSTNSGNPSSFTAFPGNDYVINGSNLININNIGSSGTGAPDIANSLTVTDVQASLLFAAGGALDVTTTLSLARLLDLGTAGPTENSVLSMGGAGGGGTISLGSSGELEGALGDKVQDIGTSPTEIIGSGTILAEGGIFSIGTSVQVNAGTSLKLIIFPNATLSFADAIGSGTVQFGTIAKDGSGVLDVGSLFSFDASVKFLTVGTVANSPSTTSYIDFLNAGTAATATLTGITTSGATLTVFSNGGSQVIPIIGNYATADGLGRFTSVNYVSDGTNGTDVFFTDLPCYAAGTAILTPDGEVAVETIQQGDLVMTSEAGRVVPRVVRWAGFREIDLTRHPNPGSVAPIRFRPGALGPDLPRRDLLLSPDHCLFIDGRLVPAKLLVNRMSIVRDMGPRTVSYHHVELERHGLLLAEGVAAESYLDTGNRAFFSNAGIAAILHPEFGINEHLGCWETDACAPLLVRPDLVRPVWERFAGRAKELGFAAPILATTTDPDLRLVVDGRTVRPFAARNVKAGDIVEPSVRFLVLDSAASVRLLSRSAERQPWIDDPRSLGVAVRSVMLRDRTGEIVLGADHPALTDGWHAAEQSPDGAPWRWTGGDAVLPIVSDGPCLLEITLAAVMTYIDEGARLAA